jgi:hypothetical protein
LRRALGALARASSIDTAARVFADEIERVPRNRQFRVRFEANLAEPAAMGKDSATRWLFVLVPGWLYRTDPGTGADLAPVRAVLGSLGLASLLVALDENGTIDENAITLALEIEQLKREGRRLILVSTSKGGPETYLALDRLRATGRANEVAAWVNIGGLLNGTAVADHWSEWPRTWFAAAAFALRGHGTASIESMTTATSRARLGAASLPPHVLVVNYVAVPMAADVQVGVRDRFDILSELGPNDGLTLLADAIVPQGITLVERGYDHFFALPDLPRRARALTVALLQTLDAGE